MRCAWTKVLCLLWLGVATACFTVPTQHAHAQDKTPAEGLSEQELIEQTGDFSAFDFYIGGNYYGIVYGYFGDDWLAFENPQDVLDIVPDVRDKTALLPLFEGRIFGEKERPNIGKIVIDVTTFRADLTIDPDLTYTREVEGLSALGPAEKNFAVRNETLIAGSTPTDNFDLTENITVTHDTLLNRGRTSFTSVGSLSSAAGYELTEASLNQDLYTFDQEMTASVGLLEAEGQSFARSIDFYGFNLKSNEDLLFFDELNQGTRIEIFLQTRSLVEVYRDSEATGRTIYSRTLDFGTVVLDTREFPEGSYNIEIVATDNRGNVTRETRPFTKTSKLVPSSAPQLEFSGGLARDDLENIDNTGVIYASYRKRLTDQYEVGLSGYGVGDDIVFEGSIASTRAADMFGFKGLVETRLTAGIDIEGRASGVEGLLNLSGEDSNMVISARKVFDRDADPTDPADLALTERDSINFNYSTPLDFFESINPRLNFSAQWSNSPTTGPTHRYGPEISVPLDIFPRHITDLKMSYTKTDSDHQALMSLAVRQNLRAWQRTYDAVIRDNSLDTSLTTNFGLAFNGLASTYDDWRRNLNTFVGLRLDPVYSSSRDEVAMINADVDYLSRIARLNAYFDADLNERDGIIGGEFKNTLLWSKETGFKASGETLPANSAFLAVAINGVPDAKVEVTVNGLRKGYGVTGETVILPLQTYKALEIDVQNSEDNDSLYVIKEEPSRFTAYPGNYIYRQFTVLKSIFIFGELVDTDGAPIANKRFKISDDVYYTDDFGTFTLEYAYEEGSGDININADPYECSLKVPTPSDDEVIVEAGQITCQ